MTKEEYTKSYREWANSLFGFALRCGATREEGQDAVQEAYIALWKNRQKVEWDKGKSYLLSCTYKQVVSQKRHLKVVEQVAQQEAQVNDFTIRPNLHFDLKEAMECALQQLPSVQRALLQLRDVEGYSYKELENILGLSDQQVQVYLFRARVAMKKNLIRLGYGPEGQSI